MNSFYGTRVREIDTETRIVEPPTVEPVSLAEVKLQRKWSSASLDTLFNLWIGASRQEFEEQTGIQINTAMWDYYMDAFPQFIDRADDLQIEVPRPPLQSVVSVSYRDDNGDWQDFSDSTISPSFDPFESLANTSVAIRRGRVSLKPGYAWPTVADRPKSVRVRFLAGFGDAASDVPDLIRNTILLMVGTSHRYSESIAETRGTILTLPQVDRVIRQYQYAALPQLLPRRWCA
jgi:uncharacterized phiE125 gp8 family phage protein